LRQQQALPIEKTTKGYLMRTQNGISNSADIENNKIGSEQPIARA